MLIIYLLLFLLPVGNAQTGQRKPNGFLLPKYPPLAARALLNADLELKLVIERDAVKSISFSSCRLTDRQGVEKAGLCPLFEGNIEKAIQQWHFSKIDSKVQRLTIGFRSIPSNAEPGQFTYYVYRVDGRVNRVDRGVNNDGFGTPTLPKEITIEYHFPIPVVEGYSAAKPRK